ncbi:MAG: hypothetical protein R3255_02880 [Candidatus Lokiarchaeia archaeon]|nr:hypothetical protein [Candidatus Lokiarchaeia archaeon]
MLKSDLTDLKSFVKREFMKEAKKVRGKHSPISELVDNIPQSLKVEKIHDLSKKEKYCFLLIVRNYSRKPKLSYFLAISLAYNSSDLLVQFAREYALKNGLKLIQYSVFPKTLRIQLLLLKELKKIEDYPNSIDNLRTYRKEFRATLLKMKNLIENN